MTFKPDEIRAQIERDRIARQARENFRKQARENLRGAKNFASTQNKLLRERDAAVKDALANNVAKYQVPEGTDASGMLELTFGNDKGKRSSTLTGEQLAQYAQNIATAQTRFSGGITPQQVIDLSTDIDRERCNAQIFLAGVFSRKGDTVRYATNAGPDSKDTHHAVTVQFLGFSDLLTGARERGIASVKKYVTGGKIRFTCDCGRHRYYYSYLAGLGNYHLGQKETRIPFINNPTLAGVACKHVLRVMHGITSATGAQYMLTQIKKDRAKMDGQTGKDAPNKTEFNADLDQQHARADHERSKVTPTTERKGYQEKMRRAAEREAKKQAEREAKQQQSAQQKEQDKAMVAQLLSLGWTQAQIDAFRGAK